ncbi:hypothetical protein [Hymenobacter properus]|uniref:Uncharacterized protein n=1 Tax=Hymenobacter properus TaxID=2791026 RepID=A0A931FLS5_9BACT|nr:hypothetical protein [Hymenobacter properus]MBF9142336.1 hypothetical protein [Hymenobacter properus]MBR7721143.1 hypothetical protein [Microvirga sp. SRT04]
MSDYSTDFYHQKTDDELRFFIEHPEYYQPDLIDSARRELRRRGGAWAPPLPEPMAVNLDAPAHVARAGRGVNFLNLALAAVLLLGMGYFYYSKQRGGGVKAVAATAKPHVPPRLVEVPTSAIPTYDGSSVADQLVARMPAAEKKDPQALRQFRELARRFWTAEMQTEYLTGLAHAGKAGPMFAEQTTVVRQTWSEFNKGAAYSYRFGPKTANVYGRMREAASSQQHILEQFPGLLDGKKFLTDKELVSREADVQDWLKDVLPASPVTGKPYKATVLTIKY